MTEETIGKLIQGITIAQHQLSYYASDPPGEGLVVLPKNTADHIYNILDQTLHAIAEEEAWKKKG